MRILRKLPRLTRVFVLVALIAGMAGTGCGLLSPHVERTNGIPYGKRGERTLGMDVIRPDHPNGVGIVMLVSGG